MSSPSQSPEPEPVFVSKYGFVYNLNREMPEGVPECSIEGVKPTIESVPIAEIEQQKAIQARIKNGAYKGDKIRHCLVCGEVPTKLVTYHMPGASRLERYCDACLQKQEFDNN